ncbi:MAG TPA: glycosyltransferase family 39 protein [Bryobacteraceae bacterium]|nr:glycosyltransferase family 39 protein [Bryobacteraceae bacterium]
MSRRTRMEADTRKRERAGDDRQRPLLDLPEAPAHPSHRTILIAAGSLVAVWALLFTVTWAHWGNLTIDCGREMYVPSELARGKTLYRDIWYLYTPLGPYLNSWLFRIFGTHLTVLYWAGSLSALAAALLVFSTGLRLTSSITAWTAAAVMLMQSFSPSLFSFPLSYSFGAVYGCVAACLCLWLCVRACDSDSACWVTAAGLAAALALLAKLEFGPACWTCVALPVAARGLRERPVRRTMPHLAALLPGILLCAAAAWWMVSLRGAEFLTQENLMSWPGSYFMRTYGATWLAGSGFSLSLTSLKAVLAAMVSVTVWYGCRRLALPLWIGLLVLGLLGCAAFAGGLISEIAGGIAGLVFFPPAAVFLVGAAAVVLIGRFREQSLSGPRLKILMLFVFACILSWRTAFANGPEGYSIYYNGPIVLATLIVTAAIARGTAGLTPAELLPCAAILLATVVRLGPHYSVALHYFVPLDTARGRVYRNPASSPAYETAIDFMQEKAQAGEWTLSVPEDTSLYFLSGARCPTRVFAFTPGLLAPGKMTEEVIRQIEAGRVRYLIWSNREFPEYGARRFGLDFDQPLGRYLISHYRPVRKLGPDSGPGWKAQIWERNASAPEAPPR